VVFTPQKLEKPLFSQKKTNKFGKVDWESGVMRRILNFKMKQHM
jgi:hypothetical protein